MTNSHDPMPDETDALGSQVLTALPLRALRRRTIFAGLGFLGLAIFDALLNFNTVGSSFSDELGQMVNPLIACAFSLLSVSAWLFVGWLYMAGRHWEAIGAYVLVMVIVGFLSAPMAAPFVIERWASLGFIQPNFVLMTLGMALFTVLLSIPGLLLILQEQRLAELRKCWRIRSSVVELLAKRAEARAMLQDYGTINSTLKEHTAQSARIVDEVVAQVKQEFEARRAETAAAAEREANNLSGSKASRLDARKKLERYREEENDRKDNDKMAGSMKLVGWFLLLLTAASPAWAAPSPVEAVNRKPVLLLLLDNTFGSPALEPAMLPSIERRMQNRLERLPNGSQVIVFSVGDPKQIAEIRYFRVQARISDKGGPVSYLKPLLHSHLEGFPARQHPDKTKGGSHLIQGWFDAANLLNPKAETPNAVLFVTDAIEFSPLANCYRDCRLPKPSFTLPQNTSIEILGIGHGQSSEKTIALFAEWRKWFADAGIPSMQLLHVF